MIGATMHPPAHPRRPRGGKDGAVRLVLLALVCFLGGAAVSGLWLYQRTKRESPHPEEGANRLSAATRAVLERLDAPVEARFYALLDPATVPEATRAFAARAERLLATFAESAGGKLKLVRQDARADYNVRAAAAGADGLQAFNADQGNACFLGVVLTRKDRKEILPRLAPEWEPALEPDLARALARLTDPPAAAPALPAPTPADVAAAAEVNRLIPDAASVSLAEGTQLIRAAALTEFQAAAAEFEARIKAAEQEYAQAQTNGSDADRQAALTRLQTVQAERAAKLPAIALKSKAQVQAWERLKSQ